MNNRVILVRKWVLRYIKYNLIGAAVFLLSVTLYYLILFPAFGEQGYVVVSVFGGIVEFTLITYFNKTKRGIIFDSCLPINEKPLQKSVLPVEQQLIKS